QSQTERRKRLATGQEEYPIRQRVYSRAREIPAQVSGPREPDRKDGNVRDILHGSGPDRGAARAADQFGRVEQSTRAPQRGCRFGVDPEKVAGDSSARAGWPEADPKRDARLPEGPESVRVLRGLRSGCGSSPKRVQRRGDVKLLPR